MRLLLVVNASASSVTARARVVIQKALAADHDVTVAETSRRGHAIRLAQGAASKGDDVVVVLGGDGTLNEAANGLAGSSTALGVLPGGSTNVFARTIGMTNDPVEATGQLLTALHRQSIRRVSLGEVNGRYFLFHVGIGYDAAVVAQVERRSEVKRYAGHALFVWASFTTWLHHYDHRHPAFSATPEGGDPVDGTFGICLKSNPYTYLGDRPLDVVPGTGFDTGLAMVTFKSLALGRLLPLALRAVVRGGGLAGHRAVSVATDLDSVVVKGYRPVPYQVDGDYLGEADELTLRCRPDALALVLP
ncbi:MAG: diacylglycerol kinase family lipid kinase [Actinomycetota bacterium]|nr:diacylglycerol kinase family lipid kinase [Actinomycetota bacterium]